jgi:hypothetical protein
LFLAMFKFPSRSRFGEKSNSRPAKAPNIARTRDRSAQNPANSRSGISHCKGYKVHIQKRSCFPQSLASMRKKVVTLWAAAPIPAASNPGEMTSSRQFANAFDGTALDDKERC